MLKQKRILLQCCCMLRISHFQICSWKINSPLRWRLKYSGEFLLFEPLAPVQYEFSDYRSKTCSWIWRGKKRRRFIFPNFKNLKREASKLPPRWVVSHRGCHLHWLRVGHLSSQPPELVWKIVSPPTQISHRQSFKVKCCKHKVVWLADFGGLGWGMAPLKDQTKFSSLLYPWDCEAEVPEAGLGYPPQCRAIRRTRSCFKSVN